MTLDEKAITKLKARRQAIVDDAHSKIERMDFNRNALIKEVNDMLAAIDSKIAFISSTPRYARPKRPRALSAKRLAAIAAREADQRLIDEIAAKRNAAASALAEQAE